MSAAYFPTKRCPMCAKRPVSSGGAPMNTTPKPYDQAFFQSVPTASSLHRRKSIPLQLWRFVTINLKIMQVVRHSHPPKAAAR